MHAKYEVRCDEASASCGSKVMAKVKDFFATDRETGQRLDAEEFYSEGSVEDAAISTVNNAVSCAPTWGEAESVHVSRLLIMCFAIAQIIYTIS